MLDIQLFDEYAYMAKCKVGSVSKYHTMRASACVRVHAHECVCVCACEGKSSHILIISMR
jgi:hypothetical protein